MKINFTLLTLLLFIQMCFYAPDTEAQKEFTNEVPIPYAISGPDWRLNVIDTVHNFDPTGAVNMVIDQSNGDTLFFNLNASVQAFAYNNPDSTNVPGAMT